MANRQDGCVVAKIRHDGELHKQTIGGIYPNASERFQRGVLKGLARCIKTDGGVVEDMLQKSKSAIVASRGRILTPKRTEYGKQIRKAYEVHEIREQRKNIQHLEMRTDGLCNTLTTVTKDNLLCCKISKRTERDVMEETNEEGKTIEDYLYKDYGIFKLTERECLRLMAVSDGDIDKMERVNSKTQLYKQAGNSIVVTVLMAIFSQLHIKGVRSWNEMEQGERQELIDKARAKNI